MPADDATVVADRLGIRVGNRAEQEELGSGQRADGSERGNDERKWSDGASG
jgi:hypothetical protein